MTYLRPPTGLLGLGSQDSWIHRCNNNPTMHRLKDFVSTLHNQLLHVILVIHSWLKDVPVISLNVELEWHNVCYQSLCYDSVQNLVSVILSTNCGPHWNFFPSIYSSEKKRDSKDTRHFGKKLGSRKVPKIVIIMKCLNTTENVLKGVLFY